MIAYAVSLSHGPEIDEEPSSSTAEISCGPKVTCIGLQVSTLKTRTQRRRFLSQSELSSPEFTLEPLAQVVLREFRLVSPTSRHFL